MPTHSTQELAKLAAQQALPPDTPRFMATTAENLRTVHANITKKIDHSDPALEQQLLDFVQSSLWRQIKKWIGEFDNEYKARLMHRFGNGVQGLEEVGIQTMIWTEVEFVLNSLVDSITLPTQGKIANQIDEQSLDSNEPSDVEEQAGETAASPTAE